MIIHLNVLKDGACLMSLGNEFHILGPQKWKKQMAKLILPMKNKSLGDCESLMCWSVEVQIHVCVCNRVLKVAYKWRILRRWENFSIHNTCFNRNFNPSSSAVKEQSIVEDEFVVSRKCQINVVNSNNRMKQSVKVWELER